MKAQAEAVVADLFRLAGLSQAGLEHLDLSDASGFLPSSFAVGLAAQASTAAAAAAANEIYALRTGAYQSVRVSRAAAERECTGYFQKDGGTPDAWAPFSGLYETADGHVRIHANFDHHRDGALRLLGLNARVHDKADVSDALARWSAQDFEDAAAGAGLVVSRARSFEEWDRHPHALAAAEEPPLRLTRLGGAPPEPMQPTGREVRPLHGLRVLELTRILAGPVCGRTLAAYGADVMLINAPHLPNIDNLLDTSRGKRSALLDLKSEDERRRLRQLVAEADVFIEGYRPGGLAALGFGPEDLAALRPGIVSASLSAYGSRGPWSARRGFDSLVQTATGFNHAEAAAFSSSSPQALPVQILDYASGFLMALGVQAALLRRAQEGGSWHVSVSLLSTANWLRQLGRTTLIPDQRVGLKDSLREYPCEQAVLLAMPHGAEFSETPARWERASALPGRDAPAWIGTT